MCVRMCRCIFLACMYTEWWDLDEPCAKGEVEAVILSHTYAKMLGEQVPLIQQIFV